MIAFGFVLLSFVLAAGSPNSFQDSNNLFTFIDKRIKTEMRYEGLIKDKCMTQLIEEACSYFGSTYFFMSDGHNHGKLLHTLQNKFMQSYYTDPSSITTSITSSYHLEIFNNNFTVKEVIKRRAPNQNAKFFLLVKNYKDAIKKFEILWKYRIIDVVASYAENDTVYYYTYFPYCSTHCGEVGRPYLMAKCNISTGIFGHKEKLFPQKVKNLHRCPVNVSFTENVPSSYYGASAKLEGWEVDLVNEIIHHMNGVPNYLILNAKNTVYRTSEGYRRLVENAEVGGGLVVSLKGLVKTDFCFYGYSLCTTWIVPKRNDSSPSFDFLIKVFPINVWILTIAAYLITSIVITVFFKASWQNVLFKLLPFLLGTTTTTKKTSRFLGALWIWFCLNINSCYQSGYQSLLLVPDSPKQLSSTQEVLETNLKILGVSDVVTDAIPYFKNRYNISSRRLRLLDRMLSFEDWVYRMTIKKDSAFLGFRETVKYNVEGTELADKLYIPQYCVIRYLLAFVLKKHSHLTESFTKFSNRVNENGLVNYFIRKHLSTESKMDMPKKVTSILKPLADKDKEKGPQPIDMNKMYIVFMCYLMGILISFAAFIVEVMSKWNWRDIRKKILREVEIAWPCID